MRPIVVICYIFIFCCAGMARAQGSPEVKQDVPLTLSYYENLANKLAKINRSLVFKSRKQLASYYKQEEKVIRKMTRRDSARARQVLQVLASRSTSKGKADTAFYRQRSGSVYLGKLDSLQTAFNFLEKTQTLLPSVSAKINDNIKVIGGIQHDLDELKEIQQLIEFRKGFLTEQLSQYGMIKELAKLNIRFGYYQQQIQEYVNVINEPHKLAKSLLSELSKMDAFRDFFERHSELSKLFRIPSSASQPGQQLTGLQTRAAMSEALENRFGKDASSLGTIRQNMQQADMSLQGQKSSSEKRSKEKARLNLQKTKPFRERFTIGVNFQSQRARNMLPVKSDVGFSLGYKLDDKREIGIGASYKVGWGEGLNRINVSHEGLGLRTYLEWRVLHALHITGGYEMNYFKRFRQLSELKDIDAWQQSFLIGVSKSRLLNSGFFKKAKIQLLWDLLSHRQAPKATPIVFRIGYNFR